MVFAETTNNMSIALSYLGKMTSHHPVKHSTAEDPVASRQESNETKRYVLTMAREGRN